MVETGRCAASSLLVRLRTGRSTYFQPISQGRLGAIPRCGIIHPSNAKHRRTLEAIFARPVRANVRWNDVEALLLALGAERIKGRGSRVTFILKGEIAVLHRPHPRPEIDKAALVGLRDLLTLVGVAP